MSILLLIIVVVIIVLIGLFTSLHLALLLLFHGSVSCCFLCCVHHFGWCEPPSPNSIPPFQAPPPSKKKQQQLVFSFYKCNITKMCNIDFDADREITSGTGREGRRWQRRRILFRGRGGSDFIFFVMYCNFYFIMLLFSLSLALVYFFLEGIFFFFFWAGWGGMGWGLYHFKRRKKMCIVWLCKGLSSPSFSLSSFASSPPSSYITLRWRDES